MRSFVASLLLCLGIASPALASPAAESHAPTALRLAPDIAAQTAAAQLRRLGLALPELSLGPLTLEIDTLLGPVRLEFLSLEDLTFQGSLVRVLEDASPASSPSTTFDRTELLDRYVIAVPILWF
jgi:hypothetical protein